MEKYLTGVQPKGQLASSLPYHLRRHSVSGGQSKERPVFIARSQEHAWRQRCARWQQAEHRDRPP